MLAIFSCPPPDTVSHKEILQNEMTTPTRPDVIAVRDDPTLAPTTPTPTPTSPDQINIVVASHLTSQRTPSMPALDETFKKSLVRELACFRYLDQHFHQQGTTLHDLSCSGFKAAYTHTRQVLIVDDITSNLHFKLGSTTSHSLQELRSISSSQGPSVRICRQDVLNWAKENSGTYDNKHNLAILSRSVYDELQIQMQDSSQVLSDDRRAKERCLADDLALLFAPQVLDHKVDLTEDERQVTTLTTTRLKLRLDDLKQLLRVISALASSHSRPVRYIDAHRS